MIRMDHYTHSKRPYAVNLGSFTVGYHPPKPWVDQHGEEHISGKYWTCRIGAVWFRGKVAAPEACVGEFRWNVYEDPITRDWPEGLLESDPAMARQAQDEDALRAVAALNDGRYGGDCWAKLRSDGTMWTAESYVRGTEVLAFERRLTPILQRFPEVPEGWDGWWRFPTDRELLASR